MTLRIDMLHHAVDYTPYEGIKVTGWPVTTISRYEIVCDDGECVAAPDRGQFLKCDLPFPVEATGAL